ncbi:MAG: flavodoxin-dependent (E)-4-hydroxy-3-methylbut-2-enyl-diphosphate synthase [Verrucomicrobiota bacterium]
MKVLSIERRKTRRIYVGSVAVGGGAPVSVQSMTKTDTRDVDATLCQIDGLASAGCDIIRVAVPDDEAAQALWHICRESALPVVADVHFRYDLAIKSVEAGAAGLRINPGNIGDKAKVAEVVKAAAGRKVPIRVGVNSGSLQKDLIEKYGGPGVEALVESALRSVSLVEQLGYRNIKISAKSSNPMVTVAVYRRLSERTDYPLHLGVTEAGTLQTGTIRSCSALSALLYQGIGDTIRISLTADPVKEVQAGLELLRCFGYRGVGPSVISCPTCGRTQVDVVAVAGEVEAELEKLYRADPALKRPVVAVMGCVVNGPGEAKEADIAAAGGRGKFALYVAGRHVRTVDEGRVVDELVAEVRKWGRE